MSTRLQMEALREQIEHGAHLVLTRSRKPRKPCKCFNYGQWRRRPHPDIDDVVWHIANCEDPQVGLVPSTIGATVLDVDTGRADALIARSRPDLWLPSNRVNGVHLYYADTTLRDNADWEFMGCGGQVRSANGYVIQTWHPDNPIRIAESLNHLRTRPHEILPDLFDHYSIVIAEEPQRDVVAVVPIVARRRYRRSEPIELRRIRTYLKKLRPPIGDMPGNRNVGLFNLIRRQSYIIRHEGTYAQSVEAILSALRGYNALVSTPIDDADLVAMAKSVCKYYRTYSPEDQRRRGALGGVASGLSRKPRTDALAEKCLELRQSGMSNDEIADEVGRSSRQVRRLLSRLSQV